MFARGVLLGDPMHLRDTDQVFGAVAGNHEKYSENLELVDLAIISFSSLILFLFACLCTYYLFLSTFAFLILFSILTLDVEHFARYLSYATGKPSEPA